MSTSRHNSIFFQNKFIRVIVPKIKESFDRGGQTLANRVMKMLSFSLTCVIKFECSNYGIVDRMFNSKFSQLTQCTMFSKMSEFRGCVLPNQRFSLAGPFFQSWQVLGEFLINLKENKA